MMKLQIQTVAVDKATPFARVALLNTSEGSAQPSGEYETP